MNRQLMNPSIPLNLTVENITTYLLRTGWKPERYPGKHLLVFRYHRNDDKNEPIRLVLPDRMDYGDWELRSKEALELLAFIEGRTLDILVSEIRRAEEAMGVRDIIKMRSTRSWRSSS